MSVQETKEDLDDEAYRVVEATNDDGTINAQVVETPTRDGDDLIIKATPLIPDEDPQEFILDWPQKNSSKFEAVRLARQKVGGFQAISQLKNERVRLDDIEDGWELVVPEEESTDEPWLKPMVMSKSKSTFTMITGLLFLVSLGGIIAPFALLLLYPFGVEILSIWQGMSVLVGSFAACIVTVFILDEVIDEDENDD